MKIKARPFDARLTEWLLDTRFIVDNELTDLTRQFFFLLRTESTQLAYFKAIKRFFKSGLPIDVEDPAKITPFHIQAHLNMIGSPRPANPTADRNLNTRSLALAALRRYFRYLKTYGRVERNPAAEATLSLPKRRKGKTRALSMEQVWTILDSIETTTPVGRRDAALIAFLAFTGARIGGALKLIHKGLEDPDIINFFEKGFKEQSIYMPEVLVPYLDAYLEHCIIRHDDEPVFRPWDAAEENFALEPLDYYDAYLIVRTRAAAAGIDGKVTPHCFRATALTELLKAGMPLQDVSRIANHARLETTRLYDRRHQLNEKDRVYTRTAFRRK